MPRPPAKVAEPVQHQSEEWAEDREEEWSGTRGLVSAAVLCLPLAATPASAALHLATAVLIWVGWLLVLAAAVPLDSLGRAFILGGRLRPWVPRLLP